ncbi:DNA recombination protein RmuC [Ekhidna sp.]|jgi:DNA recombination protein RmuC|uniref:DNA recombination protein RmuC n=1 Tax=Ekhidna sp. TaxID=2608089 RepID=UPI0032F06C4B
MEILITSIVYLVIIGLLVAYYRSKLGKMLTVDSVANEYIRKDIYDLAVAERDQKDNQLIKAKSESAILATKLENEMKNLEEEKKRLKELEKDVLSKFEAMASKIARTNADHFKKDSSEQLDQILKPLNQSIEKIEKQIKETNESRIKETTELRGELKQLGKLNHELQMEASNLTKALTMNPKHQGNWGEKILETLLEKAGLIKNLHYEREVSGVTDEQRLRADVIIHLPENRQLVIDSKVSLNAYTRFCSTEGSEGKEHLKEHVRNLKNHIDKLSKKRYEDLYQINSPDMILMFLPIEGSLVAAVQTDPDLFQYAIERNVMITTSSTLFVSLKIVSDLWQRNKQFENAELIAEEAGKLHGQVMKFLEDMHNLKKNLDNAQGAYDSAYKRLSTGRNNVVRVATRIEDLGAKVKPGADNKELLKKMAS